MSDKPTVESVAREIRDLPWADLTLAEDIDQIARWSLARERRAVKEALGKAAHFMDEQFRDTGEVDLRWAAEQLRRLAAEYADEV